MQHLNGVLRKVTECAALYLTTINSRLLAGTQELRRSVISINIREGKMISVYSK